MRTVALLSVTAAAAGTGISAAAVAERPGASLRLVSLQPLLVQGEHFAPRERTRVDLSGVAHKRVRVVAKRTGSFTVRFDSVAATRCDVVRVIAIGSRGSRAVVKYLPAPACLPA